MKRKLFTALLMITMCIGVMAVQTLAADTIDFTDASANQSGNGWTWNSSSQTLTLSGAAITEAITLPTGSTIVAVAGTENSIVPADDVAPVTTSGELTISGSGKLTLTAAAVQNCYPVSGAETITITDTELTTYGWAGLNARHVAIRDAKVDIRGYGYGIYYKGDTGSSSVSIDNVSGSIIGELDCGIELYMEYNSDNSADNMDSVGVIINNCAELTINGEPSRPTSNNSGHRSAIWVYTRDAETNAFVEIANSNLLLNGSGGGIYVNSHSDNSASDDASAAWVNIDESVVSSSTATNYWAAIFVNNNGTGDSATSIINIINSSVQALCPNDVAIMTSTKDADSIVNIDNSAVEMVGAYAGIRAKANASDAGEATVTRSTLLITGGAADNYHVIDEMDNGSSSDGSSGISSDSKVVIPIDCVIAANGDGTWTIPAGGTVTVNGETVIYESQATIKPNGIITESSKPTALNLILMVMLRKTFAITTETTEGGAVTYDGDFATTDEGYAKVRFKHDITYTIKADDGYIISDVLVDGESVGAVSEYTFENVGKKHTISAVFAKSAN